MKLSEMSDEEYQKYQEYCKALNELMAYYTGDASEPSRAALVLAEAIDDEGITLTMLFHALEVARVWND